MNRPPFRLTPEQYTQLTSGLDPNRVGRNQQGFSHLEAWDVRRWLIRIFGFGNVDIETKTLDLVREIEHQPRRRRDANGVEYGDLYTPWTVVYRAQVRLTIWDQFGGHVVFEDGACGDSTNQPALGDAHDNAAKTALSQALKRCAVNFGDQFGLSLYNNGSTTPVVVRSLVAPDLPAGAGPSSDLPADDGPVHPEPNTTTSDDDDGGHADRRRRRMHALFTELGYSGSSNRQQRLAITARLAGLTAVTSSNDLNLVQVEQVIAGLERRQRELATQKQQSAGVAA